MPVDEDLPASFLRPLSSLRRSFRSAGEREDRSILCITVSRLMICSARALSMVLSDKGDEEAAMTGEAIVIRREKVIILNNFLKFIIINLKVKGRFSYVAGNIFRSNKQSCGVSAG